MADIRSQLPTLTRIRKQYTNCSLCKDVIDAVFEHFADEEGESMAQIPISPGIQSILSKDGKNISTKIQSGGHIINGAVIHDSSPNNKN